MRECDSECYIIVMVHVSLLGCACHYKQVHEELSFSEAVISVSRKINVCHER